MKIRDRIKSLRRVSASELKRNPKNWRTHPDTQRSGMEAVLREIGYADALLARETEDGLELIDGHLRADISHDEKVPVLVLNVTEEEADKLLATFDPLGAMAEADDEALASLMQQLDTQDPGLDDLLNEIATGEGIERLLYESGQDATGDPVDDPSGEWQGMPEFEHEDKQSYRRIIVHFEDQGAVDRFAELIEQTITDKTRSLWYPEAYIERYADKRYAPEP